MNSMRSMWKLFVGVAGLGLLITNCTIKTDDNDDSAGSNCSPVGSKKNGCTCAGNLTSYQLCTDDGTYSACGCDIASGGAPTAGASSVAGATSDAGTGGAYAVAAGAGTAAASNGDAGAAGEPGLVIDP